MNVTFLEDHISVASGNSFYKAGDEATLRRGKELVNMGVAREGWDAVTHPPKAVAFIPPDLSPSRKVTASKAVRKLAEDNNLLIYSIVGTGKNGRITMADVEALIA